MQDGGVLVGLAVLGVFLFLVVKYPGQAMVAAGIAMLVGGVAASLFAKTALNEITAALGLVGGLISVGLGLAVIQLVAIRKATEATADSTEDVSVVLRHKAG